MKRCVSVSSTDIISPVSCSTSSHWHQSFCNQQEVTVGVDEVSAARCESSACFCSPFTQSENDPLMRSCRKKKQLSLCGCISADGGDGYAGCLAVKASRRFVSWFLRELTSALMQPLKASDEVRVWCVVCFLFCLRLVNQTEQHREESHFGSQRMLSPDNQLSSDRCLAVGLDGNKERSSLGGLEPPSSRLTAERAGRLRHRDMLGCLLAKDRGSSSSERGSAVLRQHLL